MSDESTRRRHEAIGRMAGGVAHELNTPLQFVSDNLAFVRDAVGDLLPLLEQCRALAATAAPSPKQLAGFKEAVADADLDFLTEELPRAAEESRRGLDRVSGIVKSMRDLASADGVSGVDVAQAVDAVLVFAKHAYKYVADVEVVKTGELPLVSCHAGKLHLALLEKVVEAAGECRDVKPRGRIVVSLSAEGPTGVRVRVGGSELRLA